MHASGTLDELAALWSRVPLPGEEWHPWAAEIRQLDHAVRAALAVLAEAADADRRLEALLEADRAGEGDGAGRLGEAVRLLARLPRPVGHHPFLDEIVPGLEAAGVLLEAVAGSAADRVRFERLAASLPPRAPVTSPTGS